MSKLMRLIAVLLALVIVGAACDSGDDTAGESEPPSEEATGGLSDEAGSPEGPAEGPSEEGARVDPASGAALVAVVGEAADGDGEHLADANGFSLYLFGNDEDGVSNCTGGCAATWSPLVTPSEDVALGEGVDAGLIGTIERADGSLQVTYAGHPLYYFGGDTAAGETNGQGSGGIWFLVAPDGSAIEA